MNFKRRDVVKMGGAAITTGAITGLAGCSSILGDDSSLSYDSWLVSPQILEADNYLFNVFDVAEFVDNEDEFDRDFHNEFATSIEDSYSEFRFRFSDFDTLVTGRNFDVITADYDEDDVIDELRANDYTRGDEYEGYNIQVSTDESQAWAVGGDEIVGGQAGREAASSMAKYVVDTEAGDEDRYQDYDQDMEALVDAISSGTFVTGRSHDRHRETDVESGRFANREAIGSSFDMSGDTTDVELYMVFRSEGDLIARDIEDWAMENLERPGGDIRPFDETEVSEDGRVATIETSISTIDLTQTHLLALY